MADSLTFSRAQVELAARALSRYRDCDPDFLFEHREGEYPTDATLQTRDKQGNITHVQLHRAWRRRVREVEVMLQAVSVYTAVIEAPSTPQPTGDA